MTIKQDDPRFWDVRTLERRLRKGQITKKDYEKHLKSLDDVAGKQAPIDLDDDDDEPDPGANGVHSE
ncbi:MAG TPA: hypothetical protein VGL86_02305 [Polyangia bacterium]|jgi:predicted RNA-binding protein associated with RNAse of E/G family